MTRRLIPALLLASTSLMAVPTAHAGAGYSFQPREWTMPSGFRVLYLDDGRFGVVHMATSFPVGSANAPANRPDLAHIAEHLWFRSKVDGHAVMDWLDAMGCTFNATTAIDVTNYITSCPVGEVDRMLDLHAHLLRGQFDGLTQQDVDIEASITEQEYRWREDKFAANPFYALMRRSLFSPKHGHHLADTTTESFAGTTLAEVQDFVKTNYTPAGAINAFIGDATQAEFAEMMIASYPANYFHPDLTDDALTTFDAEAVSWLGKPEGEISWYPDPEDSSKPLDYLLAKDPRKRKAPAPPDLPHLPSAEAELDVGKQTVVVGWSLPGSTAKTYWPVRRLGAWASKELRTAKSKMSGVGKTWCLSAPSAEAGIMFCAAELDDKAKPEKVAEAMKGMFEGKWDEAREQMLIDALSLKDPLSSKIVERDRGGFSFGLSLTDHLLLTDHVDYFDRKYGQKGGAIIASVRETADSYLTSERAAVVFVKKREADVASEQSTLARFGEQEAPALPPVTPGGDDEISKPIHERLEFELDNGVDVSLVSVKGLPLTYYNLIFRNPADTDPEVHWYTSQFFFRMPDNRKDRLHLVGRGGEIVRIDGGHDYTNLRTISSPSLPIEELVAGLRTRLKAAGAGELPTNAELELWKMAIMANWTEESYWREQFLMNQMVDADAVRGMNPNRVEEVSQMPESELMAWFDAKFHPDNANLVVVGNQRSDIIRDAVEEHVTKWKPRVDKASALDSGDLVVFKPDPKIVVWPSNGKEKLIDVEYTCPIDVTETDRSKRWALAATASRVLRDDLFSSLRRQAGAVYSPYANHELRWGGGEVYLKASATEADLKALIESMRGTVKAIADGEISDDRLAVSQQLVIENTRTRNASGQNTLGFAIGLAGAGGGLSVVDTAAEKVRAISAADVASVVSPCVGHEIIFLKGPEESLTKSLEEAGITFEVYDWKEAHKARLEAWDLTKLEDKRKKLKAKADKKRK